MKCYYAHPINTYNSQTETDDIKFLRSLGLTVVNPAKLSKFVEPMSSYDRMLYFYRLAEKCDCLAFRSFPDGSIGAGVAKEIWAMESKDGMVFELDPVRTGRLLTIPETRKLLISKSNNYDTTRLMQGLE